MTRKPHRLAFATAAATVSAVVTFPTVSANAVTGVTMDSVKQHIQLVVSPHEDDALEGWSLIDQATDNYNVFITLTRGEGTANCPSVGLAIHSPACGDRRVADNDAFMNAMNSYDSNLGTMSKTTTYADYNLQGVNWSQDDNIKAPHYPWNNYEQALAYSSQWEVGPRSARIYFNLGDGDLTQSETEWAIKTVIANVGTRIPRLASGSQPSIMDIIGADYYNVHYSGCGTYNHTDHLAEQHALWNMHFAGVTRAQWGATCYDDPDVNNTGGRLSKMSIDTLNVLHSNFETYEGWLAPGGAVFSTTYEQQGDFPPVGARQAFWRK